MSVKMFAHTAVMLEGNRCDPGCWTKQWSNPVLCCNIIYVNVCLTLRGSPMVSGAWRMRQHQLLDMIMILIDVVSSNSGSQ
jgi:hypothetical protein